MNEEWNFEEKTSRPIYVTLALITLFIAGVAVWCFAYPVEKYSLLFWIGVGLLILPLGCLAEGLGNLGFEAKFIKRWPRFLRITFGVLWGIFCLVVLFSLLGALSAMVA